MLDVARGESRLAPFFDFNCFFRYVPPSLFSTLFRVLVTRTVFVKYKILAIERDFLLLFFLFVDDGGIWGHFGGPEAIGRFCRTR